MALKINRFRNHPQAIASVVDLDELAFQGRLDTTPARTIVNATKGRLMSEAEATPSPAPISPEVLKLAFQAFKKRLKATRLDDESRVGHGPMSGGNKSGVVAIIPPNQYPTAVWEELVRQGKLKYAGQGFYEMGNG